jgi:hypothetical protein
MRVIRRFDQALDFVEGNTRSADVAEDVFQFV